MNTPTIAEIVTFRLKPNTQTAEFLEAAHAMTTFLRSTDAMVSRSLSVDEAGQWSDHITWVSKTAAEEAASAMFARPEAGPFMNMIDPDNMTMQHAEIGLYLPPE